MSGLRTRRTVVATALVLAATMLTPGAARADTLPPAPVVPGFEDVVLTERPLSDPARPVQSDPGAAPASVTTMSDQAVTKKSVTTTAVKKTVTKKTVKKKTVKKKTTAKKAVAKKAVAKKTTAKKAVAKKAMSATSKKAKKAKKAARATTTRSGKR